VGDFDFLLMGILFGPDAARLNSLVMFETPEGKYLKFGIAGVPFRPDGFDLNQLNLYLDEEVMVPAYHSEEIRLLTSKEGDPGSGSFIRYDCDGFKDFNLKAVYPFSKSLLINPANSSLSAEALLTIATPTWGNFTATAHMSPFIIPELEGWLFEVVEAGADFAADRNIDPLVYPEGYLTTGIDWKGFYIKTLKVSVPDGLNFGNLRTFEMSGENLVIDHRGISGSLKGYNWSALSDTPGAQWDFSLRALQLSVLQNHLVNAKFVGDMEIRPLHGLIRYEGTIFKAPGTSEINHSIYATDIIMYGRKIY